VYRISDDSGTQHTLDPGVAKNSFETGETVRVTMRAANTGSSGIDANWVLNLAPSADHSDVRFNSDPTPNNTNDKTIPNDGQWHYYSFDWIIGGNDPESAYDAIGVIRDSLDWNNVLEDTETGPNTTSVGANAWVTNQFSIGTSGSVTYGTTVITHGYRKPFTGLPSWMFDIAGAILNRAGKGRIWKYDEQSESFVKHVDGDPNGEQILIFDWGDQSNNNFYGYSEAAGDALLTALIMGEKQGKWSLGNLHFIGHSRGAVVNSEVVERFIKIGKSVDHVTNLDPHDWGFKTKFTDDFDVNPNLVEQGVVFWEGTQWADTYYQDKNNPENITARRTEWQICTGNLQRLL